MSNSEDKEVNYASEDYDSILSEFDRFAAKGVADAVGYGYQIGDMVWGKVKSHPWWPGIIYNEAFASPTVRRSKREGHVLVAFFGDSSYGWFDLSEVVPFEVNFAEKSSQTSSRAFTIAVEEAVDELSRRRSLGLACRCRNEFNFWPSNVKDYFVVDVGAYEPGVYSLNQINKARESFRPREMLSFVKRLALTSMNDKEFAIDFIKNKASVLACRKAMFEEFDDTYAQAFGTAPERPPRPTAPMAMDPSKAPLSGRLVIAEPLNKKTSSAKPAKSKEQAQKDKYLFKRREEPIKTKTKKKSSGQVGPSADPLLIDGSGLSGLPPIDSQIKGQTQQTSVSVSHIKPSEGPKKFVGGGIKKAKAHMRSTGGELGADNATMAAKKKKRKKEISTDEPEKKRKKEVTSEANAETVQLPFANSDNKAEVDKVSLPVVPLTAANNQLDNQGVDFGKSELTKLVRDLRALSLNPFHGAERKCAANAQLVFLKYRSLVYQKSLVSSPPPENETGEAQLTKLPASNLRDGVDKTNEKSTVKLMKRLDDPTRGGKKRGPSDRPEAIKKKKQQIDGSEDTSNKRKRLVVSEDVKKKKKIIMSESKLSDVNKTKAQKPSEGKVKEIAEKKNLPSLPKPVKKFPSGASGKREQLSPTMLMMKFPSGASLPSGAELRARFARFGPLDHASTRVYWKTYACRLVYHYKADAEDALRFARGSSNLFGSRNVKCYLRDSEAEAAESEPPPVKVQKEDVDQRTPPAKIATQQLPPPPPGQQSLQLKSCLKKPIGGEEGGNGNGRGNTPRVKFILGGDKSSKTEQVSSFAEADSSSSTTSASASYTTHSMDLSSKNLPKFNAPTLPNTTTSHRQIHPHHHQFQKIPINIPLATNDISQELLNLLTRCSDVVNNLTGALGYVPYHSL
ncbi:PREDICTED: uncharacterized protein LOC105967358 [Erythranthe guttata]|uniref:uncharacterized protein LOC105967358 n=1 Tax=Erythranthe guttata TaxID=4155 RepID=UPI00064D8ABB|nr:PREDICTED: uncharacterized protein LOC105967358 [Erythranthe guttata]|eukprot:XP_012847413.1 PREDICTED: uncharacterized protein LOC105967358 [Erythranthe guttata]